MRPLRAVLVTPLSGPLADFGRAGAAALALWTEEAHDLSPVSRRITLTVEDAHPDPARAIARALATPADIVFGPYGSSPTLAVARATGRVVWNHGGATSALHRREFPHVVNLLAPAATYFHGALEALAAAAANPRVAVIHAATGFASDVATGAVTRARQLGFAVSAHELSPSAADLGLAGLPDADVVLVAGRFEDELAAARQLLRRRWLAAGFVGAGVEDVLAALGARREGLLGPAQWVDRVALPPDEGSDAAWFVKRYRDRTGSLPPYPAAQAFAAGVVAGRCLRDAGTAGDEELLAAARALRCRTLLGSFDLDADTGLQIGHRVLTVQWQQGTRRVVWPPEQAEAPLALAGT